MGREPLRSTARSCPGAGSSGSPWYRGLGLCLLAVLAADVAQAGEARLRLLAVREAGPRASQGEVVLGLSVVNGSGKPLWVEARFVGLDCLSVKRLQPRQVTTFHCTPPALAPGTEVPVHLRAGEDEGFASVLEEGEVALRIEHGPLEQARRQVEEARRGAEEEREQLVAATTLPRTFERIGSTQGRPKLIPGPAGQLTVTREALEWAAKKQRVRIALSTVRRASVSASSGGMLPGGPGVPIGGGLSVGVAPAKPVQYWVTVEHGIEHGKGAATERTIFQYLPPFGNFNPNPAREAADAIALTIAIARVGDSGPFPVSGETRATPMLQAQALGEILRVEREGGGTCGTVRVTAAAPEHPGALGAESPKNWAEIWHLDRCGSPASYRLTMRLDDRSGDWTVEAEPLAPPPVPAHPMRRTSE